MVFLCFQGVWKQTSGIKWVNNRFYLVLKMKYLLTIYPTNIYLFKVNNRNSRKGCEKDQWRRAGVFIFNFKHSSDLCFYYIDFEQVAGKMFWKITFMEFQEIYNTTSVKKTFIKTLLAIRCAFDVFSRKTSYLAETILPIVTIFTKKLKRLSNRS